VSDAGLDAFSAAFLPGGGRIAAGVHTRDAPRDAQISEDDAASLDSAAHAAYI
jgi:hypothetical protein